MGRSCVLGTVISVFVASTAGMFGQHGVAGSGAVIRATGFFTTEFPTADPATATALATPPLNWTRPRTTSQRVPQLNIFVRPSVSTFHGSCDDPPCSTGLEGQTVTVQNGVRDDDERLQAFQTNLGSFFGRLDQFEGTFSLVSHLVLDRSKCQPFFEQNPGKTCPGSLIPFEGRTVVIAGTGIGDLEGVCGGGTFKSIPDPATGQNSQQTAYDYTFRFGAACNANNP
jgi:hypothetical protein